MRKGKGGGRGPNEAGGGWVWGGSVAHLAEAGAGFAATVASHTITRRSVKWYSWAGLSCGTARKGVSLWQDGSRSARKDGVFLGAYRTELVRIGDARGVVEARQACDHTFLVCFLLTAAW